MNVLVEIYLSLYIFLLLNRTEQSVLLFLQVLSDADAYSSRKGVASDFPPQSYYSV